MGIAQEIWQAFITAHPEVTKGDLTLQGVNRKMDAFTQARNQQPHPDFDGLSPHQMHFLLSDPWGPQSVMRLKGDEPDALLDQVPFLVLMEALFQELITTPPIKLTPKGNLPLALCRSLYERKRLVQDDIERGITKKISEDNVRFLQALKACLSLSAYVKKRQNAFWLTQAGQKALGQGRAGLLKQLLTDYTLRFNWAYLDDTQTDAGHFGWAYSLHLLHRYGTEWQETDFYATKVLMAFPHLREPIPSGRLPGLSLEFERVYRWRFIEQFACWFGLIELRQERQGSYYPDPLLIRKTPLLDQLFQFIH